MTRRWRGAGETSPRFLATAGPLLVAAALTLAGCATGDGAGTTTPATDPPSPGTTLAPAPPDWLVFFADYPRYLQPGRRLEIAVTNEGDREIEITAIALRADHFDHLPPQAKSTVVPPDRRIDLHVDFGEVVDCDSPDPLGSAVDLEMAIDGGPTRPYTVVIDPEPLDLIHTNRCGLRVIDGTVDIGFAEDRTVDRAVMSIGIDLLRTGGDEPVTVEAMRGSDLFTMNPDPPTESPVATLEEGAPELTVPVHIGVSRCDAHAVGQAPKPFEFKLWIAVGEREPQLIVVEPDGMLETELLGLIDACLAIINR